MIKINLLRNVSMDAVSTAKVSEGVVYSEVKKINPAEVAIKLLVILVLPVALMQYENYLLSGLEDQMAIEQQGVDQLNKEIQQLGGAVEVVKQYKDKSRIFREQIEVIAKLSESRLDGVFALDTLQNLIPDRLWLTNLKIDERKMSLSGLSSSGDDITSLIQRLEDSVFFDDVIFTSAVEQKTDEGILQKFEVNCTLESI